MEKQVIEIDLDDYEITYNVFEKVHQIISILLMWNEGGKVRITFESIDELASTKK